MALALKIKYIYFKCIFIYHPILILSCDTIKRSFVWTLSYSTRVHRAIFLYERLDRVALELRSLLLTFEIFTKCIKVSFDTDLITEKLGRISMIKKGVSQRAKGCGHKNYFRGLRPGARGIHITTCPNFSIADAAKNDKKK